jgi:prophage regulatory protein
MQAEASQLRRTDGIAREAERRELTGVSTSSWYALQAQGLAPKPVKLGPRAVGWLRSELLAWVVDRIAERDDRWQRPSNQNKTETIESDSKFEIRAVYCRESARRPKAKSTRSQKET